MATKTITLEMDAYKKLLTAKKAGESISEVVRRASFSDAPLMGEKLRAYPAAAASVSAISMPSRKPRNATSRRTIHGPDS